LRQSAFLKELQHVCKGFWTKIATVVIGQGHGIEMFFEHRNHARVCSEREHLIASGAFGRHHAFQIGDANIGFGKKTFKVSKGIASFGNELARVIV
jgi:hypothetical protein